MKDQEANIKVDFKRITLGNILSIAIGLAAIAGSYYNLKSDISVMQNDIAWIKQSLSSKGIPAIAKNP